MFLNFFLSWLPLLYILAKFVVIYLKRHGNKILIALIESEIRSNQKAVCRGEEIYSSFEVWRSLEFVCCLSEAPHPSRVALLSVTIVSCNASKAPIQPMNTTCMAEDFESTMILLTLFIFEMGSHYVVLFWTYSKAQNFLNLMNILLPQPSGFQDYYRYGIPWPQTFIF